MWILISWLHPKPADQDPHCFPKKALLILIMQNSVQITVYMECKLARLCVVMSFGVNRNNFNLMVVQLISVTYFDILLA